MIERMIEPFSCFMDITDSSARSIHKFSPFWAVAPEGRCPVEYREYFVHPSVPPRLSGQALQALRPETPGQGPQARDPRSGTPDQGAQARGPRLG